MDKDRKNFSPKFFDADNTILGKSQYVLHVVAAVIETLVALLLLAGTVFALFNVPEYLTGILNNGREGLRNLVSYAATIIIVIEFVHVIISQNLESVTEIMMLAITRELVISEYQTWELLAGVLSIAILFAIRKYLTTDKKRTDNK